MRNSNYLFTKGSIVFVKYPATSDNAFLNGRPLIVVSNPSHILRTLIVCTTGTQDKPGIKASFYNHVDKCYVGDAEVSNIYPYSLKTIYTDQIVASIGQLDPFIMAEIDKAIDFHFGRTTEIPKYLENCSNELVGVLYNQMRENNITKEIASQEYIPAVNYKRQHKKSESSNVYNDKQTPKTKKLINSKSHIIKSSTSKKSKDFIMQWATMAIPSDIDFNTICTDTSALSRYVDHYSIAMICSRAVPLTIVADKYNINKRNATLMRTTLTNMLIKLGTNLLRTSGNIHKQGNLSEDFILGIILAKEFSKIEPKNNITKVYSDKIGAIMTKYKINFNDKRIWKSIESFYTV